MVTKEHILSEIRRTAVNGAPLGIQRFEKKTGIRQSDWAGRFWTCWSDAVREAGFKPNRWQEAFSEEHLLVSLISLTREVGRFTTSNDLRLKHRSDPSFPSHNTFDRLGRKADRARKMLEFCTLRDDFGDVADIARSCVTSSALTEPEPDEPEGEDFGFVYLMKSGKHYKIGRSVSAEKRAYEIQLQLPEELKIIHKIKTDDPAGIEAYWHQRFSDKHVRGEWFKLNSHDIKAFRRRKFM
jgi:hypothetical protein